MIYITALLTFGGKGCFTADGTYVCTITKNIFFITQEEN